LNAQLYACESACIYKWTKACVVPAGRVGYCAISHIYLDVVNYALLPGILQETVM